MGRGLAGAAAAATALCFACHHGFDGGLDNVEAGEQVHLESVTVAVIPCLQQGPGYKRLL